MSNVNNPTHYATKSGVAVIEITRHLSNNLGNAVKYMLRAGKKGDAKEDMAKAAWYLVDEYNRLDPGQEAIHSPRAIRWLCANVADHMPIGSFERYLLSRMATDTVMAVDLAAVAFCIHLKNDLNGKDLPMNYDLGRLAKVIKIQLYTGRFGNLVTKAQVSAHYCPESY